MAFSVRRVVTVCAIFCCVLFLLFPTYADAQDWQLSIWGNSDPTAPAGDYFAAVWAGMEHNCALRSNHSSMCWGNNTFNQVSPTPTLSSNYFVSFGLGEKHSCAVVDDGTVLCWGDNSYGQATPPSGLQFQLVVSGRFYSCGLLISNSSLVCWGSNIPALPTPDPHFTGLALTVDQMCGLLKNGSGLCLGSAMAVPAGLTFQQVCVGGAFACGVLTNGTVVCWGDINQQLVVPADDLFASISCGWYHVCGLRPNNTIRCWPSQTGTWLYVSGPNSNPQLTFAGIATSYYDTTGLVFASPSPSPSPSLSRSPSPSPSPSLSRSPSPSPSPSCSPSPSLSPSCSPSPSLSRSPSPTPSSTPLGLVSNATEAMPLLHFAVTQPKVGIQPADETGTRQNQVQVGVAVGQVAEVDANGTALLSAITCPGEWSEVSSNNSDAAAFGAKQSFVFAADLVFNSTSSCSDLGASDRPRMELQYFTFAQNSTISLGNTSNGATSSNLTFSISPSFAKFTLRLFHWPWLGAGTNRVEVGISISPAFTSYVRLPDADGVTTFVLRGQDASTDGRQYSTQVRLAQAVTLDDVLVLATNDSDDRAAVAFALDVKLSLLVLSFARFNTSLEYDPDIGVLLGRKDGGGGDSNLPIIVGTAVAVPVAIGLVLVVVVVGVVVLKRRLRRRADGEAINISLTDFSEPDTTQL